MKKTPYRNAIKDVLISCYFERASMSTTKETIIANAEELLTQADTKGDRFYTLFYFELSRLGLRRMTFGYAGDKEDAVYMFYKFILEWERNPKLRNAKVLAEYL